VFPIILVPMSVKSFSQEIIPEKIKNKTPT